MKNIIEFENVDCVTFEVTQKCNLMCSYCFRETNSNTPYINMTNEIAEQSVKFLEKIIHNTCKTLTVFFFGGEPLLNLGAIKRVVYLINKINIKKGKSISYKIITNGTLLNNDIKEFIFRENIDLQISLDGNKTVHDLHRKTKGKKGSQETIIKNLKEIFDSNEHFFYNHISLKSTYTKETIPIIDIICYFDKLNIKDYSVSPVTDLKNPLSPNEVKSQVKMLFSNIKKELLVDYYNKTLTSESYSLLRLKKASYLYLFHNKEYPCSAGREYICIGANGKIYPCHRFFDMDEYSIGDIWGKKTNKSLFESYNLPISKKDTCKECEVSYWCGGTCTNLTVLKNNRQYVDPTYCEFNKNMIRESIKLFNNISNDYPDLFNMIKNHLKMETKNSIQPITLNTLSEDDFIKNKFLIYQKSEKAQDIDLDEEGILFFNNNLDSGKKYIANTTTMAIWDLINGKRIAQDIAREIATVCEVEIADIEVDIYNQLATLQELGFLKEAKETADV